LEILDFNQNQKPLSFVRGFYVFESAKKGNNMGKQDIVVIKDIIALHEAGHIVVAHSFGVPINSIKINKDGFILNFIMDNLEPFQKACIYLAGHITSITFNKYGEDDDIMELCRELSVLDLQKFDKACNDYGLDKDKIEEYIVKTINEVGLKKLYDIQGEVLQILNTRLFASLFEN
jgi:hypothetical protein